MDQQYTHAIILDFEATCDDVNKPQPQEIIEFPSVVISLESKAVVAEFESFVRPLHHPVLTDFCKNLTSINQADVDEAELFPIVFEKHRQWLSGLGLDESNAVMVTCGDWDLKIMLPIQCASLAQPMTEVDGIYTRWQNIKHTYCKVLERKKSKSMAGMLRGLELPLLGRHHRGIDDCRNIAEIYKVLLQRGGIAEITAELITPPGSQQ